jgi:hemerythrin
VTEDLTLDITALDETHDEFLQLLETVKSAQGSAFTEGFAALIEHTEAHFAMEEALMHDKAFYGMQEHQGEHETLLCEMRYFFEKAKKIPAFGRSYIDDYAFDKFKRHIINIDSQLAMFLKSQTEAAHA